MDRLLRLIQLWPYLPAFRVVAETEHLPTAAERLHVTPSALSRSISLLESRLGRLLFDRHGRRLRLNDAGTVFLSRVRDAMRLLDDSVTRLSGDELSGPLRVLSASQMATTLAIRALPLLHSRHPLLLPELSGGSANGLATRLLQGEIDVALVEQPVSHPALLVELMGEFTNGVYCGPGHPLYRRRKVGLEHLQAHPFVAPPRTPGPPLDDWPAEAERHVALRVDQMQTGASVCASGGLLGVFPDVVVATRSSGMGLRRLPWDGIPPLRAYVITRPPLHTKPTPVGEFVAALEEVVEALAGELRSRQR